MTGRRKIFNVQKHTIDKKITRKNRWSTGKTTIGIGKYREFSLNLLLKVDSGCFFLETRHESDKNLTKRYCVLYTNLLFYGRKK